MITASINPSWETYRAQGGDLDKWEEYLAACVREFGRELDVSGLNRFQTGVVRRLQSGLSARPVDTSGPPAKRKRSPKRAPQRRPSSLWCSCANCRSGRESLCLRD